MFPEVLCEMASTSVCTAVTSPLFCFQLLRFGELICPQLWSGKKTCKGYVEGGWRVKFLAGNEWEWHPSKSQLLYYFLRAWKNLSRLLCFQLPLFGEPSCPQLKHVAQRPARWSTSFQPQARPRHVSGCEGGSLRKSKVGVQELHKSKYKQARYPDKKAPYMVDSSPCSLNASSCIKWHLQLGCVISLCISLYHVIPFSSKMICHDTYIIWGTSHLLFIIFSIVHLNTRPSCPSFSHFPHTEADGRSIWTTDKIIRTQSRRRGWVTV